MSFIVTQAYKRPAKTARLSQSATLCSTGDISAEGSVYKNKAGHNSTRGIVSSVETRNNANTRRVRLQLILFSKDIGAF